MKQYLFIILSTFIFIYCATDFSGTTDETSSGICLYKPDGTPAVGAIVQFYIVGDTSKQFIHQTQTDDEGKYSTEGVTLSSGSFNVWAQLGDTLVAIQDSVYITNTTHLVKDDTLGKPGSISGIVGLQSGHDPRTITVQALGTHIYTNVNTEGEFTLSGMAGGEYSLRLTTTLPEYTDTFCNVVAHSGVKDTLEDTLWLIYTGIPVVTGMSASYDTLNGVVTLTWDKTNYSDFQDYLIYRDHYDSVNLSPTPIASSIDTIYRDTIFQPSNNDTNDYHFKYRFKIRNNSQIVGNSYKLIDVTAVSPEKVKTQFTFSAKNLLTGNVIDTVTIDDTVQIEAYFSNKTRPFRKLLWAINTIDSIKQVLMLDTMQKSGNDTLKHVWSVIGNKKIYTVIEDITGTIWLDSIIIIVLNDLPVVYTGRDTALHSGDTIKLHCDAIDKYGMIAKYEWGFRQIDQTEILFTQTSSMDTIIGISDRDLIVYFRATDDDGNASMDSLTINIYPNLYIDSIFGYSAYLRWNKKSSSNFMSYKISYSNTPISTGNNSDTIVYVNTDTTLTFKNLFSDTIYYFQIAFITKNNSHFLSNEISDTTFSLWSEKTEMPTGRGYLTTCTVNNKIYAIGGYSETDTKFLNVVEEYDPETNSWSTKTPMPTKRRSITSSSVNGKIYVIGGYDSSYKPLNVVEEYNPETNSWSTKTPMPTKRSFLTSSLFNGKIYVFGGTDSLNAPLDVVEEYDPTSDAWSRKSDMPTKRFLLTSNSNNEKIIVIGGYENLNNEPFDVVEEYDPESDTWNLKSSVPIMVGQNNNSCVIGNRVFLFVDDDYIQPENGRKIFEYSWTENRWIERKPFYLAHTNSIQCSFSCSYSYGIIYIIGGVYAFVDHNNVTAYKVSK